MNRYSAAHEANVADTPLMRSYVEAGSASAVSPRLPAMSPRKRQALTLAAVFGLVAALLLAAAPELGVTLAAASVGAAMLSAAMSLVSRR